MSPLTSAGLHRHRYSIIVIGTKQGWIISTLGTLISIYDSYQQVLRNTYYIQYIPPRSTPYVGSGANINMNPSQQGSDSRFLQVHMGFETFESIYESYKIPRLKFFFDSFIRSYLVRDQPLSAC